VKGAPLSFLCSWNAQRRVYKRIDFILVLGVGIKPGILGVRSGMSHTTQRLAATLYMYP
jgi:hypothetical protein